MSTLDNTYGDAALGGQAVEHDARALLGQVMGYVAVTVGFAAIPGESIIYAVAGLGIFGAFAIYDFNRLRRSTLDAAVPIAAGIFLDIFNVFLLFLDLFGGQRD
jgi:FtsH-binding integral membrane protein